MGSLEEILGGEQLKEFPIGRMGEGRRKCSTKKKI
jgi:hypothetical protein